jgi:hypothetical protein
MRTRAYRREVRNRAITRKKNLIHTWGFDWYDCDGKYSKGKIHCGCSICKWGRKFGLPTLTTERELEKFHKDLEDYYND